MKILSSPFCVFCGDETKSKSTWRNEHVYREFKADEVTDEQDVTVPGCKKCTWSVGSKEFNTFEDKLKHCTYAAHKAGRGNKTIQSRLVRFVHIARYRQSTWKEQVPPHLQANRGCCDWCGVFIQKGKAHKRNPLTCSPECTSIRKQIKLFPLRWKEDTLQQQAEVKPLSVESLWRKPPKDSGIIG